MTTPRMSLQLAVGLVLASALAAFAQDQERRPEGYGRREGGPPPMMNPIFAALDANGDGVIDEQEVANAPAALKKLDRNGDGKLTADEVRPAFGGRGGRGGPGPGTVTVDEIVARMLQFDKDGDGKLSKEELPERMASMMERGDSDRDGFLSREELVQLARAQALQRGGPGGDRGRQNRRGGEERR